MYRLLIAEEEPLERMVVKDMVKKQLPKISEIYEAKNLDETLRYIENEKIDIIYLSLGVAISGHLNLLAYLRTLRSEIKLLVSTTYEQFESREEIKRMNLGNYLIKPIRLEHIALVMNRMLNEDMDNKELQQSLGELSDALYLHNYKEMVRVVRSYVDDIFDYSEDRRDIYNKLMKFADEIVEMAKEIGVQIKYKPMFKVYKDHYSKLTENRFNALSSIEEIIDYIFDKAEIKKEGMDQKNTIQLIENYVERHIREQIALEDVARYCNMNIYYLSKFFKKETGINFVGYITNRKVEIAKYMLVNTDVPIVNIALELSFREANYFTRVFKKETGVSPKVYREQRNKENSSTL